MGPVAAKNTGLQAASGDYVLFLDHDDRMREGALKTLCAALEEDPDASAVEAQVQDFKSPDCQDTNVLIRPEPYYGLFTGAILIRRKVFDVIGPFPTAQTAGEIIDWSFRMQENGLTVKKMDLVSTDRRVHPAQRRIQGLRRHPPRPPGRERAMRLHEKRPARKVESASSGKNEKQALTSPGSGQCSDSSSSPRRDTGRARAFRL